MDRPGQPVPSRGLYACLQDAIVAGADIVDVDMASIYTDAPPKPDRGTSIAEITPALNAAGLELHRTPIHQARGGTTAATLMITKGPPLLCTANTTQTVRDREYMDHTFVYDPSARFQHYCGVIIDNRPDGMRRWLCNEDRVSPQKLREIVAEYFGHSLYVLNAYEIRRV